MFQLAAVSTCDSFQLFHLGRLEADQLIKTQPNPSICRMICTWAAWCLRMTLGPLSVSASMPNSSRKINMEPEDASSMVKEQQNSKASTTAATLQLLRSGLMLADDDNWMERTYKNLRMKVELLLNSIEFLQSL